MPNICSLSNLEFFNADIVRPTPTPISAPLVGVILPTKSSIASQAKSLLAIAAPARPIVAIDLIGLSALSQAYLAVPNTTPSLAPFCQLVNS